VGLGSCTGVVRLKGGEKRFSVNRQCTVRISCQADVFCLIQLKRGPCLSQSFGIYGLLTSGTTYPRWVWDQGRGVTFDV